MANCYKVLLVGDENTGKSCLMKRCAQDKYDSTAYQDYTVHTVVDDRNIKLNLCEAPSQDQYSQIRTVSYEKTHVIMVTFSIVDPGSLDNIEKKWMNEIKQFCPKIPLILVGTKQDLRTDPETIEQLAKLNIKPVTKEEGMAMADKIGAKAYKECSSQKNEGVWRAITTAARVAIKGKK